MGNEKDKVLEVFSILKSELLHDPAFDFTPDSLQWLHRMLDYNVPGGKLNRVLALIHCYQLFQEGKGLSDDDNFLACVLGWCIEWFQACALVLDDIMDNSYTRRGQPCWFRVPQVGMIAINDAIILQSHIFRILKKHFKDKPYYLQLLELFHEVGFQTVCGEMLDLITPLEGEKDLSKYSMEVYRCIAKYKGAYYSLYLPVACALLMAGEDLDDHNVVKNILVEIAAYYQIQDDYLDCFGDPKQTGKIGTDIEDRKCSWLVVKALELANEQQKKLLYEHYGKSDPGSVAKVKELYAVLDLQNAYKEYERKSFEELKISVETHPSKAVEVVWKTFIERIVKV